MVIKASSGREIDRLVADLGSPDAQTRDAAIARLTVIGARAVDRLIQTVEASLPAGQRTAALRALDAIGDARALPAARDRALDPTADPEVAAAAIDVLRGFLPGPQGVATLDTLAGLALDPGRPDAVRIAAVQSLLDLPAATVEPVWRQLRSDPRPAVAAKVPQRGKAPRAVLRDDERLTEAAAGRLPETPDLLRAAIVHEGAAAPLATLQALIDQVRERERGERGARREAWRVARGAAHAALAARGSRVALYDLKESLTGSETPLPVDFLAALGLVGDASCLEPIASAYARATARRSAPPDWWRTHLADAFRTIVKRGRITKRHAALKRVAQRWPGTLAELLP